MSQLFGALLGANALGRLAGTITDPARTILSREVTEFTNARYPNASPPAEQVINLYYSGVIDRPTLSSLLGLHGIPTVLAGGVNNLRTHGWLNAITNSQPHYPIDLLRKWTRQGRQYASDYLRQALAQSGFPDRFNGQAQSFYPRLFSDDWENLSVGEIILLRRIGALADEPAYLAAMAAIGYRDVEARQIWRQSRTQIDSGSAIRRWQRGDIPDDVYYDYMRRLGYDRQAALTVGNAAETYLDPGTVLRLMTLQAQGVGEGTVRKALKWSGITDADAQSLYLLGQYQPPSGAGLVELAGRKIWDEEFNQFWLTDQEYPAQYDTWTRRAGLNLPAGVGPYGQAQPGDKNWAAMLWRAHWQMPSFGTLAQIIYRIRGNPDDRSTWSNPAAQPLSQAQIWSLMSAMGVPPTLRNYLGQIIYQPISIRYLRTIVQSANPGIPWIAGKLMDQGYSPADANLMATAIQQQALDTGSKPLVALNNRTWSKYVGSIQAAYKEGAIGRDQAMSSLVSETIPTQTATLMLATVDIEVATGLLTQVVTRTRSEVMSGKITVADGVGRLITAGMDATRANQQGQVWTLTLTESRRQLGTTKVLSLLRKGYITASQALVRLTNLGWTQPDEVLLLAEVQGSIRSDEQKLLAKQEASVKAQERQITATLKNMQSLFKATIARLKAITPVSSIKTWYSEGYWSEDRARERLALFGYPDDVISDMLLEAITKKPPGGSAPQTLKDNQP